MRPLESRLGLRLHEAIDQPRWSVELSVRIVDNQDRVASSLLESATPGFSVWDIRGYCQASDQILVLAGVENVTDRNYREYLDFRPTDGAALAVVQPGVNFYFGTEVTY
jgi:outer membrane receptor protein involved in Fe transport